MTMKVKQLKMLLESISDDFDVEIATKGPDDLFATVRHTLHVSNYDIAHSESKVILFANKIED